MTALVQPKHPFADPGEAQRAASDPTLSVWVNASAGSGKTKVLTERVLRLLLSGVAPQKILCLTYTRAGAAEMANRVTNRLSVWATGDDNLLHAEISDLQGRKPSNYEMVKARQLFAEILSCPGGLRIRTIHSFCQEILSRFPVEAGLPPHFALIDEVELEAMRQDVLDDLLAEANQKPDSDLAKALQALIAAQGEKTFESMLQEIIRLRGRLASTAQQAGGEEKLIARLRQTLGLGPDDTADQLRLQALQDMPRKEIQRLAACLAEGKATGKERGAILQNVLGAACHAELFDIYCKAFLTDKKEAFKKFVDKDLAAKYPDIEDICAREAARLHGVIERIEAADIAERTASTLVFGLRFAQNLAARKAARAALDYDDLIAFTEKLLRRPGIAPWILYKLDNGIDHILVDEAQDTSRAQWNIVQQLSEEFFAGSGSRDANRTLFVVGDEKQSIFSFQNADPESFRALREFFSHKAEQAGKKLDKIPLRTSFRSAPAILAAIDAVFAPPETRDGVSDDAVIHEAFKKMPGRVEIWPLLAAAKDPNEASGDWVMPTGYEESQDPEADLAQQIADKIHDLVARREAAPGDIMILLRRRGSFADKMVRALKAQKIPVTGVDRMHLMEQLPVMDLLALVRFVLLPQDDLNLASLLRSPLINIGEEELMHLAIGRDASLWQALQTNPAFKNAHDYLAAKLAQADFSTVFAFLSQILNMPCPGNATSGRQALWSRLGEESLDPIEELLNKAQHFTRMREPSLQNFLHWLTQADAEIKRELDRTQGQVRMMTVHASKGLEAPIIFLPDKAALPRSQDLPKFQFDDNGLPLLLARRPHFGLPLAIWQRALDKQMQEYRRLFYVALTRAEKRLYICGWLDARTKTAPEQCWHALATKALASLHRPELMNVDPTPEIVTGDDILPTPQTMPKPRAAPAALPPWATQILASAPQAPSLAPSQISLDISAATPDYAFKRGRIIHRLLQSIPSIEPPKRGAAVARYLASPQHDLSEANRAEIAGEVLKLLNDADFAALFAPDSLAEAPVTGLLHGAPVFRQIDRLARRGGEILIVDYKTNRPPPRHEKDIPDSYRQQLGEYRALIAQIWPDSKIRCFLLWTYTAQLMEISF